MSVVIKRNLATRAREIAYKNGIPIVTVETVIREFYDSLITSAVEDERIVLDGITSITIVRDISTGELSARGRVSTALQSRINKRRDTLRKQEKADSAVG